MASNTFRDFCQFGYGPGTCMKLTALGSYLMFNSDYMFRGQMRMGGFALPIEDM